MENKQHICDLLLKALNATRDFRDLEALTYEQKTGNYETVTATFSGGYSKSINVSLDSGQAMIRDIMKCIQ